MDIATIAAENGDFDILVAALTAADLVGAVSEPNDDITVFAPTDAAFGTTAADLGFDGDVTDEDAVLGFIVDTLTALGGGEFVPLLTDILLYHVSPGVQTAADIIEAVSVDTALEGASIGVTAGAAGVSLSDIEPDVANPTVAIANIEASNGIIHAIDRVLLPVDVDGNAPDASIAEIAIGEPSLSILVQALVAADLVGAVDGSTDADLTVFAPTNDAFRALAVRLGFDGDVADDAAVAGFLATDVALLTNILLYHVSEGSQTFAQVAAADSIATLLEGATLTPDGAALVDADPELADPTVVLPDVAASNGVVHVIDGVLLPIDVDLPEAIEGGAGGDRLVGTSAGEFFDAGAGSDFVRAKGGDDIVEAGAGRDVVFGGGGADIIRGGDSHDVIAAGGGDDVVFGDGGGDNIKGGRGADVIDGGAGRDVLSGGVGADEISGGAGRDNINGGRGDDMLSGGAGRDAFVFVGAFGDDEISDFTVGADRIDLIVGGVTDFDDIDVSQVGDNVVIEAGSSSITLLDVDADALTHNDFLFS